MAAGLHDQIAPHRMPTALDSVALDLAGAGARASGVRGCGPRSREPPAPARPVARAVATGYCTQLYGRIMTLLEYFNLTMLLFQEGMLPHFVLSNFT